ncbi:hypothetical protein MKX03_003912 [Papaver bracteatum]|nr:hypothetical protein MKX03_003912 [Papaver bracteatum]
MNLLLLLAIIKMTTRNFDAGALFVLKSEGWSWIHCGYYLTTSIVAPPLLSLPFAFSSLGRLDGLICLTMGAVVTFYSYNLILLVHEHHAQLGKRLPRHGSRHSRYTLRFYTTIYLVLNPENRSMKLYHFLIIFGGILLILAQVPSFHSLRHINLISLLLCLAYSTCAVAGSIYVGNSSNAPPKDYTIKGDPVDKVFSVFNAVSVIATTFGNGIIPEIQIYLQPTNELLERQFSDPKCPALSLRNVIPRLISRSLAVVFSVIVASTLPFFEDIISLVGALGFMPLDFMLHVLFYNLTFKPPKQGAIFWMNITIFVVFSSLAFIAAVIAVRRLSFDAATYQLFSTI